MRLIFVGNGRMAAELYGWMSLTGNLSDYSEVCCVAPTDSHFSIKRIGEIDPSIIKKNDKLILAIGDTNFRHESIQKLQDFKSSFVSYLHPSVLINERVQLGVGAIIFPYSAISIDCKIDDFAFLNSYCSIGHDCIIGKNLVMSPYSAITGYCHVGNNVYLGTHSSIIPKRKIGDYVKLSAGAVAMKNVDSNRVVIGNMGQTIKL